MTVAMTAIMEERDITQTQIAETLGRSQNYVSGRLTGKHHLSVDIILAVAHLAHLTPRELMLLLTERMAAGPAPGTGSPSSPDAPASSLN